MLGSGCALLMQGTHMNYKVSFQVMEQLGMKKLSKQSTVSLEEKKDNSKT